MLHHKCTNSATTTTAAAGTGAAASTAASRKAWLAKAIDGEISQKGRGVLVSAVDLSPSSSDDLLGGNKSAPNSPTKGTGAGVINIFSSTTVGSSESPTSLMRGLQHLHPSAPSPLGGGRTGGRLPGIVGGGAIAGAGSSGAESPPKTTGVDLVSLQQLHQRNARSPGGNNSSAQKKFF